MFDSGAFATMMPRFVAAGLDLSFLPALAVTLARPLFAAGNRRNYLMLGVVAALWLANLAVHLEALGYADHGVGRRANFAALGALVQHLTVERLAAHADARDAIVYAFSRSMWLCAAVALTGAGARSTSGRWRWSPRARSFWR